VILALLPALVVGRLDGLDRGEVGEVGKEEKDKDRDGGGGAGADNGPPRPKKVTS
jgi:hypothetical protein